MIDPKKKKKVTWINNSSSQHAYKPIKQLTVPKYKAVGYTNVSNASNSNLSTSSEKITGGKKRITGALGSVTRRKQYDKYNLAYDNTIAKNPKAQKVSSISSNDIKKSTTKKSTTEKIMPVKKATKKQIRVNKRITNKKARVNKRQLRKNK
jgi:hypothetical protein|tara:strand:+ start:51 stop:503 length:453 start_codon:yes stop_codon:yes gene_type:complete